MPTFGDSGTVQWATQAVAGGASPGDDFTVSSGTASLSFMNPQFYVDIPIKYDTVSESPEPFQVVLSNPTGSLAIMVGSTTINITDNNPPPPPPPPPGVPTVNFFGPASYVMMEGESRVIHVVRDIAFNALTVSYVIAQESVAKSPDVTLLPSGSVTFATGQTDATITLTSFDDEIIEVHELLKLSLVPYPAPNQGPGAYLVGSVGDSFTTINDNNEVIFSDLTVAWKKSDENWVDSPDNEMLWQSDQLRWTAVLPPVEVPFADEMSSVTLLRRPHNNPGTNWEPVPLQSWEHNSANPAEFYIFANPQVGDWDVTVHGLFGVAINAALVVPKHRQENAIAGTSWTIPSYDPLLRLEYSNIEPFFDQLYFGPHIYPEYTLPPDHVSGQNSHTWVDVRVTLATAPAAGFAAHVYLKSFDPDHAYNPPTWSEDLSLDPNDLHIGASLHRQGNDNRTGAIVSGGGGFLLYDQLSYQTGELTQTNPFKILSIQPGNNFRVAATPHSEWLAPGYIGLDAVDAVSIRGPGITSAATTEVLTVWRTLHVEQDSMGEPSANTVFTTEDPAPTPFNLRDATISAANEKFSLACISVAADLGIYETRANSDDMSFVKQLDVTELDYSPSPGPALIAAQTMLDVGNEDRFWTVQVISAYYPNVGWDWDLDASFATLGITSPVDSGYAAPKCFIFLECIRDYCVTEGHNANITEGLTVVHEIGHTFLNGHGSPGADEGIMGDRVVDEDANFSPIALGIIQSQSRPHASRRNP
ncbi:MAG: Calx-beta domain-containing protein [Pirellulaceae bacterium]